MKSRDRGSVGSVCDRLFSRGSQTPPYTRNENPCIAASGCPHPSRARSKEKKIVAVSDCLACPIPVGLRGLNPARPNAATTTAKPVFVTGTHSERCSKAQRDPLNRVVRDRDKSGNCW